MSEIKINLLDSHSTAIGTVHGSVGDLLVAALSAEPETIDELESAFKRFEKSDRIPASSLYRYERCEIDEEPWDAGIMVIDLAARIVACDSTYSLPGPYGTVDYHDGNSCTGIPLGYRLPDDWIFVREINDYLVLWQDRVELRAAVTPLDARVVLYGEPLLNFISENALNIPPDVRHTSVCRDSPDTQFETNSIDDDQRPNYPWLAEPDPSTKAVVDIHRRWLMTPREDLHGQSPRQILFAKQDLIDFDLSSRANQWSFFLEEPPCLSRESFAYRYAGFGTHEWVMYYDMVRFLIWQAVHVISMPPAEPDSTVDVAALLTQLEQLKQQWLNEPRKDVDNYIPAEVIDNERRRRPEAMTGRSMVVDEECPCCKWMRDESEAGRSIGFWHLDGAHMEDEFAFSWFATTEEWQQWNREQEEFYRDWRRKEREREEKIARGDFLDDDDDEVTF